MLDPNLRQAGLGEAEADLLENRVDAARQRLRDLLKTEPGNLAVLTKLASLEESSGNRQSAMEPRPTS